MKRSPRRQCRHRNAYPAGIIVPCQKTKKNKNSTLQVPHTCLLPWQWSPWLKYSPKSLPASLLSSFSHDSRPPAPHFLSVSRLTLTLHIPSLCHPSTGATALARTSSLLPSLTLSAKWHFTGCFFLLIPPYFASWDSIKAFIKHTPLHKAGAKDTEKNSNYFLCTNENKHSGPNICIQIYVWTLVCINTIWIAINKSQYNQWILTEITTADSQLPMKIIKDHWDNFLLKSHRASFKCPARSSFYLNWVQMSITFHSSVLFSVVARSLDLHK